MKLDDYALIKKKAQAFVIAINKPNALNSGAWSLNRSQGEYDSTHVLQDENPSIPYSFRERYYVSERVCVKVAINDFTQKQEVEDCSAVWREC